MNSKMNYYAGHVAEESVSRCYTDDGAKPLARRWRGGRGEIDLILEDGGQLIFVEVKKSKTHDQAARNLSRPQAARIMEAAVCYLAAHELPMDTDMRFDAALVDAQGQIQIMQNALAA